jgi:ligand-binding sensor domain-containing protein/putative methionine-R-sulfoxide reductase with GAF domain
MRKRMKTTWINLSILLIFFCASVNIQADEKYIPVTTNPLYESWRWYNYEILNGKGVRCIAEGNESSIWFGTSVGIFQYDGVKWVQYFNEDTVLKSPVYGIHIRENNDLYAVSTSGICHFSDGKWITDILFPPKSVLGSEWEILNIKETRNGDIWVCLYFGLLRIGKDNIILYTTENQISKTKNTFDNINVVYVNDTYDEFDEFIVYDILESQDGSFWLAMEDGTIIRFSAGVNSLENLYMYTKYTEEDGLNPGIRPVLFEAKDGSIFNFSQSVGGGINNFSIIEESWTSFKLSEEFGGDDLNFSFVETSDGVIWIGSWTRLFAYKDNEWMEFKQPDLPIPQTRIIVNETSDGSLWVVGLLSEVFKIEYQTPNWNTFKNLNYQCETNDGKKWFLSTYGHIVYYNEVLDTWRRVDTTDFPMQSPVRLFKDNNENLWAVGSHKNIAAISYYDGTVWQYRLFPEVCWGFHQNGILLASDNSIWFGSNPDCGELSWGVVKYTPSEGTPDSDRAWMHYKKDEICEVAYALGEAEDNSILCGYYKGLFEYDGEKREELHQAIKNDIIKVESIEKDKSNGVWIGTRSQGIIYYVDKDNWIQYTTNNGLASNTVTNILVASDSTVWAVTDKGVSRFDGIKWLKYALPEHFKIGVGAGSIKQSSDGTIWFNISSMEWYRRVYYKLTFDDNNSPLISYHINPENQPPETVISKYEKKVYYPGNVTIHWEGTDAWNKTKSDELEFSYKLDNNEWTIFENIGSFEFLSLKRGWHTLKVRSRDKYMNIDSSPAMVKFKVIPPVWGQTWFIALILGFIITIVYLLISTMRKNQEVKKHNLEVSRKNEDLVKQQKEIEEKSKQIVELLEKEKENKWLNEGVIMVNDILRKNKDKLESLAKNIVEMLVEYLNIQYAGLFVLRKGIDSESRIELMASHGFSAERIKKKDFLIEEGLVGACFKDKKTIVIENIPGTYILESGLGNSKLNSLILVPIKIYEDIVGVIEIASLNSIENKVIHFLELISDNIASQVLSVEAKNQLQELYENTTSQSTKLREHKEELSQQIEELKATREEHQRKETELLKKIDDYKAKLDQLKKEKK